MSLKLSDTEKDIKDSINGSKTLKKAFKNPFIAALIGAASVGVLIIFIFHNKSDMESFSSRVFKFLFYTFIVLSIINMINFTLVSNEQKKKYTSINGERSSSTTSNPIEPREVEIIGKDSNAMGNNVFEFNKPEIRRPNVAYLPVQVIDDHEKPEDSGQSDDHEKT